MCSTCLLVHKNLRGMTHSPRSLSGQEAELDNPDISLLGPRQHTSNSMQEQLRKNKDNQRRFSAIHRRQWRTVLYCHQALSCCLNRSSKTSWPMTVIQHKIWVLWWKFGCRSEEPGKSMVNMTKSKPYIFARADSRIVI